MMHISATKYASSAEMLASYAERRNRLMGSPQKSGRSCTVAVALTKPQAEIVSRVKPGKPIWQKATITFSDHVFRWQAYLASEARSPVHAFMFDWCTKHCVPFDEIVGPNRTKGLVELRHRMIWEIKKTFPTISLPMIGRLLNRDHTTILNAIRKFEART